MKGYDYAQAGAYFVTVVTQDRLCLFGKVAGAEMRLSEAGRMAHTVWESLPGRFTGLALDVFIVMPNHIHGIIVLPPPVGAPLVGARPPIGEQRPRRPPPRATTRVAPTPEGYALSDVVSAYKSLTTADYTRRVTADEWPPFPGRLWQRNYYEHIVHDGDDLDRIRTYIQENPLQWELDTENPAAAAGRPPLS